MSGSRERPEPPGFEIPDLDLPPPNHSQSVMRAVTPPAGGQAPRVTVPVKPHSHDEFADALGAASLDLELGEPIASGNYATFQGREEDFLGSGLDLEPVLPGQAASLLVAPEHEAGWPQGVTPRRDRLVLDPLEIRILSGFGDPPSFGPLSIVYAIRVVVRKRALVRELRDIEAELTLAEKKRDDQLAELATELRPTLAGNERFARLLEPMSDLDALAGERGALLAAIQQEKTEDAARLEAERAPLRHATAVETDRQLHCREELVSKAEVLERAEARHKRDLIEIRAVEEQAALRLGPGGGDMPADLVARLVPLKARAESSAQDLAAARADHEAVRKEHEAGEQRLRELAKRDEKLTRRARDSAKRFQERLGVRVEGLNDVEGKRRVALADVGRGILATGGGLPVATEKLTALSRVDAEVAALVKRSEQHVHALDSADPSQVKRGFAWIGALLALLGGYLAYRSW